MMNTKTILKVVAASILGLALTGCGKDNYNGTYSGTEIKLPQTQTQTGQTTQYPSQYPSQYYPQQNYYQQQSYRAVTAELKHDDEIVTGTYTITQPTSQYGGTTTTGTTAAETYRFEATAGTANSLTGVRLIPMSSGYNMGGGCVLEGTLAAVQDGRRLSGTLNPAQTGYQSYSTTCTPTQITLDRAK